MSRKNKKELPNFRHTVVPHLLHIPAVSVCGSVGHRVDGNAYIEQTDVFGLRMVIRHFVCLLFTLKRTIGREQAANKGAFVTQISSWFPRFLLFLEFDFNLCKKNPGLTTAGAGVCARTDGRTDASRFL